MIIHGMSHTPTYRVWADLFSRCCNRKSTSYKYYGAKGIKVCERWRDFLNFYKDMGERPENLQIDRIDSSKDYSPENCRWVTSKENNPYNKGEIKDTMPGKIFGKWRILHRVPRNRENRYYLCECSCGNQKEVCGSELRLGRSTQCRKCQGVSHVGWYKRKNNKITFYSVAPSDTSL